MAIPFFRTAIPEEDIARVAEVLRSGWLTTGPQAQAFEEEFARYVGANHALAVSSATAGMALALAALEIGPGDDVICPVFSFSSPAMEVYHCGARPVFVDCEPDTLHPSLEAIEAAITGRTKAILIVHYAGLPYRHMPELQALARKRNLRVIEDAAHCCPARYEDGTMVGSSPSDITFFSFYANKCITCGEGGMVTTPHPAVAERLRARRLHGISRDVFDRYTDAQASWVYDVGCAGFKANLPDILAALGRAQLSHADEYQARREEIARRYTDQLAESSIRVPEWPHRRSKHAWHLYPVQFASPQDRDRAAAWLQENGVGCSMHFLPMHRLSFWRTLCGLHPSRFPVAEQAAQHLLSLPIFPDLRKEEVDQICRLLLEAL